MALSVPQLPSSGLPAVPAGDEAASSAEGDEGQDATTQAPFIGGPRPTVTKLEVNDHFYSSLSLITLYIFKHICLITHAWAKCPGSFLRNVLLTAQADGLSASRLVVNYYPCNLMRPFASNCALRNVYLSLYFDPGMRFLMTKIFLSLLLR